MSEAAKSSGKLAGEVEILLNRQVRPLLKIHGGGIDLRAVSEGGRVELEFQGACRGCPLKSVTYALGVRQKLLQLPGVREVSVRGVRLSRLSRAALDRIDRCYAGYSFWVGASAQEPKPAQGGLAAQGGLPAQEEAAGE
jgi:Fe-S cluster biogenesis protein NfuA